MRLPTPIHIQDASPDTTTATAYDSIWANVPTQGPVGIESVFLAQDKLYVVLVVVLIIWLGLIFFLYRTDARIDRLERFVKKDIHHNDGTPGPTTGV